MMEATAAGQSSDERIGGVSMSMEWKEQAAELVELLALERGPVAVTYTNEQLDTGGRKAPVCGALKVAAEKGRRVVIDAQTRGCPGGLWHCGLTPPPPGKARRTLQDFLVNGEKLTHSVVSFHRMEVLGSPPPTGLSDFLVIEPMGSADMMPDLVVFVCNGEQACRLISLDTYWDGKPPRVEITGSLCHAAVAYPAVTGNTNVTFGDWTARRIQKYAADVAFVSVPYERIQNLVAAIPHSSAGTADVVIPAAFRHEMD
jgi:uncharacterized protein (DUF169 family)